MEYEFSTRRCTICGKYMEARRWKKHILTKHVNMWLLRRILSRLSQEDRERVAEIYLKVYPDAVKNPKLSPLPSFYRRLLCYLACLYGYCWHVGLPFPPRGSWQVKKFMVMYEGIAKSLPPPMERYERMERMVRWVCEKLRLPRDVEGLAIKILRGAQEKGLTWGKCSEGCVAASVYLASIMSGDPRTQKDICDWLFTTDVNLRNRVREFVRGLKLKVVMK